MDASREHFKDTGRIEGFLSCLNSLCYIKDELDLFFTDDEAGSKLRPLLKKALKARYCLFWSM